MDFAQAARTEQNFALARICWLLSCVREESYKDGGSAQYIVSSMSQSTLLAVSLTLVRSQFPFHSTDLKPKRATVGML